MCNDGTIVSAAFVYHHSHLEIAIPTAPAADASSPEC